MKNASEQLRDVLEYVRRVKAHSEIKNIAMKNVRMKKLEKYF